MKAPAKAKRKPEWPKRVKEGNVSVTVYRRRRADSEWGFEVADYLGGARKLRSFPDAASAIKEAERIAKLMAAGEAHAAQMRGPQAASYGRAVELLRPTGVALEIAAGHFAEAFKLLKGDRIIEAAKYFLRHNPDNLPNKTVREVAEELIANRAARGKSERYVADLRVRLHRFAEAFQVPIASVTTGDVQRWIDGLKVKPQTAKNFRTVLGTLFNFAQSRGYILKGSNPVEDTERISGANGEAVEIYTPTELARLLAAAPEDFKPCIALAAFAGLRSAEVERQAWSDIDLAGGTLVVTKGKVRTAGRRGVPILPALADWLRPHARKSGLVWTGAHDVFYDRQQETVAATGTTADKEKGTQAVDPVKWKANALRHSFISYRLADIQNAPQVSMEAGNSVAMVNKHYRELVKPLQAKAWFNVRPEQPANIVSMQKEVSNA